MNLRRLAQKLLDRSPLEVGGGQATEVFAGRAIAAGEVTVVPVLQCQAQVGGGMAGQPEALGGSTKVEFVGAWVEQPRQPARWLALNEKPPKSQDDWNEWLVAHPDLMAAIARAIARRQAKAPESPTR